MTTVAGSMSVAGVPALLPAGRALLVPNAADGLDDHAEIVEVTAVPLQALGWRLDELDLASCGPVTAERLAGYDAVVVCGGDPFLLRRLMRETRFDLAIRQAVARAGVHYLGFSAGGLVAAPSLEPLVGVSPFTPPPGSALDGLGLIDTVVLPHDELPGRRELHVGALRRHGRHHRLVAITDDELWVAAAPDGDASRGWRLVDAAHGRVLRPGAPSDAADVAEVFAAAGRAAWTFVDAERWTSFRPPVETWRERLGDAGADLPVVERDGRVTGFAWVRLLEGPASPLLGELAAFYVHPSQWGTGDARRLLQAALDRLHAAGAPEVVVWTEERNARARRVYESIGFRLDGGRRDRTFLDLPITELRYRLDAAAAGT